jgi:hypothetical protein
MCCAGCVLPARSTDAFRGKALATSTTVESAVGTAVLTGELATRGRITAAYASVGFSEAETDASGAQTAFDSIQPPNAASDRVRAELDPILSDAVDTLTSMRITARRGELDRLTDDIAAARRISARLSNFQQANQ